MKKTTHLQNCTNLHRSIQLALCPSLVYCHYWYIHFTFLHLCFLKSITKLLLFLVLIQLKKIRKISKGYKNQVDGSSWNSLHTSDEIWRKTVHQCMNQRILAFWWMQHFEKPRCKKFYCYTIIIHSRFVNTSLMPSILLTVKVHK